MDILGGLGSLASAAVNWFSGEANRNATQAANQQSWAQSLWMDQNHISNIVNDAKRNGINPLAALGVTSSGGAPQAVGATNDRMGEAGQDIGRAISALSSTDDKAKQLDMRLKELQIDSAKQDVVAKQLENSKNATVMGQPGTPPGLPRRAGGSGIPLPQPRPYGGYLGEGALYQTFYDDGGKPIRLPSEKASQAMMNNASIPVSVPIALDMAGKAGGNAVSELYQHLRPDVVRRFLPNLWDYVK